MNEILTLLTADSPRWVILLVMAAYFLYNRVVQLMPEPKDVPEPKRWWYQWVFDVFHQVAGNYKLVEKAERQRK